MFVSLYADADIAGDPQVNDVLEREYASALKGLPYVGSAIYIPQMKRLSRGWFNSLATFGSQSEDALHGLLGRDTNNIPLWMPGEMPPPIDSPAVSRLLIDEEFVPVVYLEPKFEHSILNPSLQSFS